MNRGALEQRIGYAFRKPELLELALTHRSYAFEHVAQHCGDNQRLEFLGDAILDFVIAEELYRDHPNLQEGELTRLRSRLVCEGALSLLARKIELESEIRMGKGEVSASGMFRAGTLADAYESVIGAIYLDGGLAPARDFILRHHANLLADPDGPWLERDAKTQLQTLAQNDHLAIHYDVVAETGPSHAPTFEVEVSIGDRVLGRGFGKNKKEAQQAAAEAALAQWPNEIQ